MHALAKMVCLLLSASCCMHLGGSSSCSYQMCAHNAAARKQFHLVPVLFMPL